MELTLGGKKKTYPSLYILGSRCVKQTSSVCVSHMATISLVRYWFTQCSRGVHMCACYKVLVPSMYWNSIVHWRSPSEALSCLLKHIIPFSSKKILIIAWLYAKRMWIEYLWVSHEQSDPTSKRKGSMPSKQDPTFWSKQDPTFWSISLQWPVPYRSYTTCLFLATGAPFLPLRSWCDE